MNDYKSDKEYKTLKSRFDAYYADKILPLVIKNERIRSKYVQNFWVLFAFAAVIYPLILLIIFNINWSEDSPEIGLAISAFSLFMIVVSSPIYAYKKRAKTGGIMKEFASFFGTFEYEFENTLPDDLLEYSHLFKNFDRNVGDDFFIGNYNDVSITIAEEKLQEKRYVNKRTKYVNVFKGVCILFDMNKPFKGRTVVLKDGGIFNTFKRVSGMQRVQLEDLLFEKKFEVFSDDQIEARYLLTTAFMERVLKMRDLFGGKVIQFSFFNDKVLFAINTSKDMFEPCAFFKNNLNKTQVDLVFDQFYLIFSIINILKLNQKIGM